MLSITLIPCIMAYISSQHSLQRITALSKYVILLLSHTSVLECYGDTVLLQNSFTLVEHELKHWQCRFAYDGCCGIKKFDDSKNIELYEFHGGSIGVTVTKI
jgi:hypothetical protein